MRAFLYRFRVLFFRTYLITLLILKTRSGKTLDLKEWGVLCVLLWLSALFRIWASGFLDNACNPREHAVKLITNGPYAYVRNPLYIATLVMGITYAIMSEVSYAVPTWILIYVILYMGVVVPYEEEFLKKRFGCEYARYSQVVPRYLIRLKRWNLREGSFSLKEGLRNEFSTFLETLIFPSAFLLT